MRKLLAVVLGLVPGVLAGCAGLRWSGHPVQTQSATPERVSVGRPEQRTGGLPLHGGGSRPESFSLAGSSDSLKVNALLYRQRGDQLRREAAAHQEMEKLYAGDAEMSAHCARVVSRLVDLAEEYDAISRLYETRGRPPTQETPR